MATYIMIENCTVVDTLEVGHSEPHPYEAARAALDYRNKHHPHALVAIVLATEPSGTIQLNIPEPSLKPERAL